VNFSLVVNVSMAGVKGFTYFYSTTIAPRITIPAEAFKHTHITGGSPTGLSMVNLGLGENFLKVEITENSGPQTLEPFAYFSYLLERIPHLHTVEDFEAVLPWNVKVAVSASTTRAPLV
jgi:hypothetical protein